MSVPSVVSQGEVYVACTTPSSWLSMNISASIGISLGERTLCLYPEKQPYLEPYIRLTSCQSENLDQEAWYRMKYHDVFF